MPTLQDSNPIRPRIVVVPPSAEVGKIAQEMAPAGFETMLVTRETPQFASALGEARYIVCYPGVKLDAAFYRTAPRLRLVQLLSAGYDDVDLEAARRAGVPVANNGGANAISVSEHALMLMLTVARRVIWPSTPAFPPAAGAATGRRRACMSCSARRSVLSGLARSARKWRAWRRRFA